MSKDIGSGTVSYQNMDPVRILSDAPLREKADFGFDAYVQTIAGLIANKNNETPLVIGVYGKWGSGKTTLMENIQTELRRGAKNHGGDDSRRDVKAGSFCCAATSFGYGCECV